MDACRFANESPPANPEPPERDHSPGEQAVPDSTAADRAIPDCAAATGCSGTSPLFDAPRCRGTSEFPETPRFSETSIWRTRAIIAALALAAVAIAARLAQLQWARHAEFTALARRMQIWEEPIPARPGEIVDRQGRVLAAATAALSLYVDPARIPDRRAAAGQLAAALDLDAATLAARLEELRDRRFLWIKRRLSDAEVDRVRALRLPSSQAGFRTEFRRHYPQGAIAAHLLGLRDVDNRGRGGIEEACQEELAGAPGRRRLRRDARGFVVEILEADSVSPRHGARVVTTLDSLLQARVEERLDAAMAEWSPRSCTAIVIDPQTAEILALASRPAFDPRAPEAAPPGSWSNRAIAAVFEPGSTFKPFVVAAALDQGLLQREEMIDCGWGAYRMGPRVLHDHHRYGRLSVADVLVKSSNVGMAKIGERLTNAGLQQTCVTFGFGRSTGLGLPGELPGLVRPFRQWDGYSTGSIPMGQELAATPLQLIVAHAALANGGRLIAPRLIRSAEPTGWTGTEPVAVIDRSARAPDAVVLSVRRDVSPAIAPLALAGPMSVSALPVVAPIVSPETARWIVSGPLRETVERGTGREARLPGYSVFGKTGTAQVVDAETGTYSHSRHICSFIGGLPAEQPRLLALALVEEPRGEGAMSGGRVAAPIVRDLLREATRHFAIPPDIGAGADPAAAAEDR